LAGCYRVEPGGAGQVSNILLRAILIVLSVFVMTATAHAVEATAQEFLDKYKHGDVTERQTLLNVIKDLQEGVSWADRQVASRPIEARNKSELCGVNADEEHDWDAGGCSLSRKSRK
jgi:hypothetical protein